MSAEPTTVPSWTTRLPLAGEGKTTWAMPVITSGSTRPVITVKISSDNSAGRTYEAPLTPARRLPRSCR